MRRLPAPLFVALLLAPASLRAAPLEVEAEDLRPGLVAEYRGAGGAALARVEAKPAFALGHSSPHPRIPAGPFEVTWTGALLIHEAGPLTFEAFAGGAV